MNFFMTFNIVIIKRQIKHMADKLQFVIEYICAKSELIICNWIYNAQMFRFSNIPKLP